MSCLNVTSSVQGMPPVGRELPSAGRVSGLAEAAVPGWNVKANNDVRASSTLRQLSRGTVRWWWVRHAPVPTRSGLIVGQMDLPCDTSDLDSLIILADRLPVGATLLMSPMLRARQTAQALEQAGALLSDPEEDEGLKEQCFGEWEGLTWDDLTAEADGNVAGSDSFWRDPANNSPPGGESFEALVERVRFCVTDWTSRVGTGNIVAVAHAGSIRAAVALALDLEPLVALRFVIDPLSLTCLEYHGEAGWGVRCINELPP